MASAPICNFKTCSKCGVSKPATTEFFCVFRGGLRPECKTCKNAAQRADWAAMADFRNESRRRRRAEDGHRLREIERAKYAANPNPKKDSRARYYAAYPDKVKATNSAYRTKYPERRRARDSVPSRRLRGNISNAIHSALKRRSKVCGRWEPLIGYSMTQLQSHLERQFLKGMNWDNYGKWHVDHILPQSSFVFESVSDPEFKACWALTNLRPMWARDNMVKSAKRTHLL